MRVHLWLVLVLLAVCGCDDRSARATKAAEHLKVLQTLDEPFASGESYAWSAASVSSWRALCSAFGGELHARSPNLLIDSLNRDAAALGSLPEQYWYARAGRLSDGIVETINKDLKQRFPAFPAYMAPGAPTSDAVVALAVCQLGVVFDPPYRPHPVPMRFQTPGRSPEPVECFGLFDGPSKDQLVNCELLFTTDSIEHGRAEFAIDIARKSPLRVILASVRPQGTLQATLQRLQQQIADAAAMSAAHNGAGILPLGNHDTVFVPRIAWRIEQEEPRLSSVELTTIKGERTILYRSSMMIDFQLNESGVQLQAKSERLAASASERTFAFDSPFLLVITSRGEASPWFVAWIASADVLVPAH